MSDNVITVKNISKTFGDIRAVDDLSFEVAGGTCSGILGPNGAGKTTMMKMIYARCLRDKNCGGTMDVFGHDPRTNELDIKYLSGVVPQEDNLDEELNVTQNLEIFCKFYNISAADTKARIAELLDFLELSGKVKSKIKELSGGMKRRLIIARALINNPKLLILDEPTTGLDPQVRHLIWDRLRQLKKQGTTILLTTHYMEEAFQICDTVLILHKGQKIMQDCPRKLLADNIEKYVFEFPLGPDGHTIPKATIGDNVRVDESHETIRFYSDDINALKALTDSVDFETPYIRQANLEDVFLRATGRTLDDRQ